MCASCFDEIFADHRRVQRGAASGKHDAADIAQLRRRHVQSAEFRACILPRLSRPRIASCIESGLLKDLLEHVMRVIAFLDVFGAELDFADLVSRGSAAE